MRSCASTGSTCTAGGSRCSRTRAALGYVFNPLSLFWCHDQAGRLGVRGRRGAQHVRAAASLPPAPRRRRTRRHREGVLRVAVPPGRRLLPDERAGAGRPARDHSHAAPAGAGAVHRVGARCRATRHDARGTRHRAAQSAGDLAGARAHHRSWNPLVAQGFAGSAAPAAPVPPGGSRVRRRSPAGCRTRHRRHRPARSPAGMGRQRSRPRRRPGARHPLAASAAPAAVGAGGARPRARVRHRRHRCGRRPRGRFPARVAAGPLAAGAGRPARYCGACEGRSGGGTLGAIGAPPKPPVTEARLSGRLHSRRRDRAAIAHHYDLSNEFYELLLDDTMAYSSAYFTHEGQSLGDAQRAKLDLICRKLDLRPGMRLLDVGCGWGSLDPARRRALRRPRDRHHARGAAAGLHREADRRARSRRPGGGAAPGLPRPR